MVTVETISIVFTGLSVSLAAFYYISTLRNAQSNRQLQLETRQLDIYMKLKLMETDPEWMRNFFEVAALEWEDFYDFARKFSHTENPEEAGKRFALWNYWESLGYILSRGVIDPDTVFDMFGNACINNWIKFEPIIRGFREKDGVPETWKWFEYLVDEMKKVRERRRLPDYTPSWRPE